MKNLKRNKVTVYFLVEACESRVIKIAKTIKELKKGINEEDWEVYLMDQVFMGEVDSKGRFIIPRTKLLYATNVFELFKQYTGEKIKGKK